VDILNFLYVNLVANLSLLVPIGIFGTISLVTVILLVANWRKPNHQRTESIDPVQPTILSPDEAIAAWAPPVPPKDASTVPRVRRTAKRAADITNSSTEKEVFGKNNKRSNRLRRKRVR